MQRNLISMRRMTTRPFLADCAAAAIFVIDASRERGRVAEPGDGDTAVCIGPQRPLSVGGGRGHLSRRRPGCATAVAPRDHESRPHPLWCFYFNAYPPLPPAAAPGTEAPPY